MVGALTAAYLPGSVALNAAKDCSEGMTSGVSASMGTPAALLAAITMGIAGEHAAASSRGPGSFQAALLDEIFCMTAEQLQKEAQIRCIG